MYKSVYMFINKQSGGEAFGDTRDIMNLDLRGGNAAINCVN